MQGNEGGGDAPLFVMATRLYVQYKFKTRKTFDPQVVLIDDTYARGVLDTARATPDAKLHHLALMFEQMRFPGSRLAGTAKPARAAPGPMLDLSLDTPG